MDTAHFKLATGGTSLIEEVHSDGSAGRLDFMAMQLCNSWGNLCSRCACGGETDRDEQDYQAGEHSPFRHCRQACRPGLWQAGIEARWDAICQSKTRIETQYYLGSGGVGSKGTAVRSKVEENQLVERFRRNGFRIANSVPL